MGLTNDSFRRLRNVKRRADDLDSLSAMAARSEKRKIEVDLLA
jgi:hypothetical protein